MGCPVHIWVPLMAAAAPIVRVAKDRVSALRYRRAAPASAAPDRPTPDGYARPAEAAPSARRWAPIDPHAGD